jgi:fibronectin-binding autotransporter adhesin
MPGLRKRAIAVRLSIINSFATWDRMKNARIAIALVSSISATLAISDAARAAVNSWKGATSTNWSVGTNWTAGAPANNSAINFDSNSTANLNTNNDISDLTLTTIGITTPTGPVTIGGNSLTLSSGIIMTGATQDLTVGLGANDLSLSAGQTWTMINGRSLTVIAGHLYLSNTTAGNTLAITVPTTSGNLVLNSVIANSSAAGAAASGVSYSSLNSGTLTTATVQILQPNTYTGPTSLAARATVYQLGSNAPFGTGTVTTTLLGVVPQLQAVGADRSIANDFVLGGGFNFGGSQSLTITGNITSSAGRALAYNSTPGANLVLNGNITIGTSGSAAGTLTTSIVANPTAAAGMIVINGVLQDAAGVTSGTILNLSNGTAAFNSVDQLNNQNTYAGGTTLSGAGSTVQVGSSSTLVAGNIVSGPLGKGTVTFNNATAAPKIEAVGAARTVANAVTLTSNGAVQGTNDLTLSGVVSGAGVLQKKGAADLILTGANSHGSTKLFDGGVKLGTKSALGTGAFTIGDTTTSTTLKVSSTTNLTGANAVTNAVTVAKDFSIASGSSDLELSGGVSLGAVSRTITVDSSNATILSGVISDTGGTGGIIKQGDGVLILSGANTYGLAGATSTTVSAGKLLVNNTTGNGTGPGNVLVNGGTLGGTGSIAGSVTVTSGSLAPGASINVLGIGGNLSMTGGSFDYEINRDTVAADLNNVAGNLALASVALSASDLGVGAVPLAMGTKFTLINYGGTWNGGIFTGLANHSTSLVIGLNRFEIDYDDTAGGSNFGGGSVGAGSHFVTITAVPEASTFLTIGLGGIFAIAAVWMSKRMGVNVLKA